MVGGRMPQFRRNGIVRRGLYAYQLRDWLRHFPEDQLMVINHEQARKGQEGEG